MENVIDLLHDIEEKANQIIKRASDEKVKLHDALKADIDKLDMKITEDTNKKLLELKHKFDEELEAEMKSVTQDWNRQLADLETNFSKNHNTLADKIMKCIIND